MNVATNSVAVSQIIEATDRSNRWGWIETFVLIQNLSMALLFLPGAQEFRIYIRAIPYVSSLGLAFLYYNKGRISRLPPGGELVLLAQLLLVISLFHPNTHFPAGIAQCIFQFSIIAPIFWVAGEITDQGHLRQILWLFFLTGAANAVVGLLQVYYPETFMPPSFSKLALSMNPNAVSSLTYIGAAGEKIIRPPGLTDLPGGAAIGAIVAGLLGIIFGAQPKQSAGRRIFCFSMAAVGISVLYLTQVRSLLIMLVIAVMAMCLLLVRQGRLLQSGLMASIGITLLVGSFTWATAIGGKSVSERFTSLINAPVESFQQNRGNFIKYTLDELLYEYPLGAGVGRWGMMNLYFGRDDPTQPEPIWVEIQMTGWLLDGGVLMWLFYGGAVIVALAYAYRLSIARTDYTLAYLAGIILCLNFFVFGISLSGPAFNNQLGIQFWFLTAALYGASRHALNSTRQENSKLWYQHGSSS
ncbi:MAG: hypothetical protein DMF68_16665 [Acidobacteria bacterium]|nr:MAG: hypothetical protein DMF68_16665 [Acidobacteriota bacterium]